MAVKSLQGPPPGARTSSCSIDKIETFLVFMVFTVWWKRWTNKITRKPKKCKLQSLLWRKYADEKSQWRGRGQEAPGEVVPGFRSRFHPNIPLHSTLTRAGHAPTLSLVLVPHSFLSFCASHTWWQWYADMSIVPHGTRVTRCVENDTMTWIFLSSYTLCGYFIDTEQGQMFCSSTSRLRE